jgi:hypothetical protein
MNSEQTINIIMNQLKPTLGETIYDPCMNNGEFLVGAVDYLNSIYDYGINWKNRKYVISGETDDHNKVNNARNNLLNSVITNDNIYNNNIIKFNFNDTVKHSHNMNGGKYDIVVTQLSSYNFNMMNNIFASMKENARCAVVVDDMHLTCSNLNVINIREYMVEHLNVTKIVSIDNNRSIIFFDNRGLTNTVHLIDNMNEVEDVCITESFTLPSIFDTKHQSITYQYMVSHDYHLSDLPDLVDADGNIYDDYYNELQFREEERTSDERRSSDGDCKRQKLDY